MHFGRKAKLLRDLLKKSDLKTKSSIIDAFNKAYTAVYREKLTHSYIESDEKQITFVCKTISNDYSAGNCSPVRILSGAGDFSGGFFG